jgi:sterol 3beta-glucosyltransferase
VRVTLVTLGTRGDAQPMVALGAELQRRGHDVVLGLSRGSEELGRRAGLTVLPVGPDPHLWLQTNDVLGLVAKGKTLAVANGLMAGLHDLAAVIDDEVLAACEGADVVVSGFLAEGRAAVIAEHFGVPLVLVHTVPARRTDAVPFPALPAPPLGFPGLNYLVWTAGERAHWYKVKPELNVLRRRLGLATTRKPTARRCADQGALELQAYSPALVPGHERWPSRRPVIGALELGAEERHRLGEDPLAADLDAWLADGEPPAYFGFGSMSVPGPQRVLDMVARVSTSLGMRAVVSAGPGGFASSHASSRDLRVVVGAVNHHELLPRCRLAMHHGGAGTTAAVARAGIPSMVCSFMMDQQFWGNQVRRLGVGTHVAFRKLDDKMLHGHLSRLLAPGFAERARRLGDVVRSESPVAPRAADLIEKAVAASRA